MRHGALFNGIGGFQLAASWMGWENVFSSEIDQFCNTVTKYHFPNCIQHGNIKTTDFTIYRGAIDILTGGFPCQPYSQAGKRLGKEDDRHLWPEMLRGVREIQPGWVVGENVRGLTNWNGGLVFDEVQADLEAEGYEVLPFLLPACAVNAPHRRDRIWFIAYTSNYNRRTAQSGRDEEGQHVFGKPERPSLQRTPANTESNGDRGRLRRMESTDESIRESEKHRENDSQFRNNGAKRNASDTSNSGLQGCAIDGSTCCIRPVGEKQPFRLLPPNWQDFPTQPPVCNGDDGISSRLDFEAVFNNIKYPRQPARAFGKWRNESIKAGGNAIVPQVALQIFKAIDVNKT